MSDDDLSSTASRTCTNSSRRRAQNLNRNNWDYLIGGSETETTLARNRIALDAIGFRPRVLRDVSDVDCAKQPVRPQKLRIPVLCAPVGSLRCSSRAAAPRSRRRRGNSATA